MTKPIYKSVLIIKLFKVVQNKCLQECIFFMKIASLIFIYNQSIVLSCKFIHHMLTSLVKDQIKGWLNFYNKKGIVLFELLRTKKGLLYLYVSDFLQKSLTVNLYVKICTAWKLSTKDCFKILFESSHVFLRIVVLLASLQCGYSFR